MRSGKSAKACIFLTLVVIIEVPVKKDRVRAGDI